MLEGDKIELFFYSDKLFRVVTIVSIGHDLWRAEDNKGNKFTGLLRLVTLTNQATFRTDDWLPDAESQLTYNYYRNRNYVS